MEIKKLFSLVLILVLMCGCTKQYMCTKETKTDDFDYNIEMNLTFSSKKVKKVNSTVTYTLTDTGYEKIDTLEQTLQSKNDNYSFNDYVEFDFKINNKLINVYETIDLSKAKDEDRDTILTYNDLSTIYFNSKYKTDEVIEELKNNNFTCELE